MLDTVEGMSELQRIRVVIADDQELVRAGFAMVIGSQPDIQAVSYTHLTLPTICSV